MAEIIIQEMKKSDRLEVSELIYLSTNYWYQTHGRPAIFNGGPEVTGVFFDTYEALDPGCGVVAVEPQGRRIIGSCFYHPRETHVSLGIMNSHPSYAGSGIAKRLLKEIIAVAEAQAKPVRLVSSAMNLDSFSLYTRTGFTPRCAFQDMYLSVPKDGLKADVPVRSKVRPGTMADVDGIAKLEMEVSGISRKKDYQYFITNRDGLWHTSVLDGPDGHIEAFCASCNHRGSNMVGPGIARTPQAAAAVLAVELDVQRERTPVFLLPVDCGPLVQTAYAWGARNCEIHFSQVRGAAQMIHGIVMPTFLPETA